MSAALSIFLAQTSTTSGISERQADLFCMQFSAVAQRGSEASDRQESQMEAGHGSFRQLRWFARNSERNSDGKF